MKGIPVKTGDFLKNAVREFPRTPYAGAKAIQQFIFSNYDYGCDENVLQQKWARYPDEVSKFMTCQDAGIFNYLMAKQLGLDVVLAKFENFNGTDQPHLGALVSGEDNYYLLSNNHLEKIILKSDQYITLGRKVHGVKISTDDLKKSPDELKDILDKAQPEDITEKKDVNPFSKMSFLDVADVVNIIESSKGREGFLDFFATGQGTSTYYIKLKNKEKAVYSANRFLRINNNFLNVRKSYDFAGYNLNLLFTEDKLTLIFSSGINNSVLINPVDLFQADCDETNRYSLIHKDMNRVEQPDEIKAKVENSWIRRRLALILVEQDFKKRTHKRRYETMKKLFSRHSEDETVVDTVHSERQFRLAYLHAAISFNTGVITSEHIQLYKDKFSKGQTSPYTYSNLMINDYFDAQQSEVKSRFSKKHTNIVSKARNLGKEYGLNQ